MKHLRRFSNGYLLLMTLAGIFAVIQLVFISIDKFVRWEYRNNTLLFLAAMSVIYLVGCLIELIGLDKNKETK